MRTVILSESQVKYVIDNILSEQQANEFVGSTDINKMSHQLLSTKFGLPDGANNENFYYSANVADVIKMSSDIANRSKYLSIFKPSKEYGKKGQYLDYFDLNGDSLSGSGSKTFKLSQGTITASHNGLLALSRAMDRMGGKSGFLTINIGNAASGVDAKKERVSSAVNYNANKALNLTTMMNGVQDLFCALAVSDQYLKLTTSQYIGLSVEEIQRRLVNIINNMAMGLYGFMDHTRKDEIVTKLKPLGLITTIDFDVQKVISQLTPLRSVADLQSSEKGPLSIYNGNKKNKLSQIGATYQSDLATKIKEAYMANFKIYLDVYLPNAKFEIIPTIKNTRLDVYDLGNWHYRLFHSKRGESIKVEPSKLNNTSGEYDSGN